MAGYYVEDSKSPTGYGIVDSKGTVVTAVAPPEITKRARVMEREVCDSASVINADQKFVDRLADDVVRAIKAARPAARPAARRKQTTDSLADYLDTVRYQAALGDSDIGPAAFHREMLRHHNIHFGIRAMEQAEGQDFADQARAVGKRMQEQHVPPRDLRREHTAHRNDDNRDDDFASVANRAGKRMRMQG